METPEDYHTDNEPSLFAGFTDPTQNWSRLPHQLIEALPLIETLGEMKVILYTLRHTWGYHDDEKKITLDEFCNGRKRRDGSRIDGGTGLSKPTVIDGLERAVIHGFITVRTDSSDLGRVKNFYSLCASDVKEFDTTGKESCHRTEKETSERNSRKKEREGATAQHAPDDDALFYGTESPPEHPTLKTHLPQTSDPLVMAAHCQKARQAETLQTVPEVAGQKNGLSPACQEFKRATGYMPPKPWRDEITKRVGGDADALKRWYDTCFAYVGNGWNPRNAKGMLDYFVVGALPDTKPQGGNGRHDGAAGGNRVEGNGFRAMPKGPGR